MRKVILFSAMSLDGWVADKNGKIEWLTSFPNPAGSDYGINDFLSTVDTTLMGNNTYKDVLELSETFPYADKTNYVFTRNKELQNNEQVQYVHTAVNDFVKKLKEQEGKDIWLAGGGLLNGAMIEAGLIDEMILHLIPVVLGEGRAAFGGVDVVKSFDLTACKTYETGVVELHYRKK